MDRSDDEQLLDRKEAAKYLGLKNHNTLAVWASTKRYDLKPVKIGRRTVRYKKSELDKFIDRNIEP